MRLLVVCLGVLWGCVAATDATCPPAVDVRGTWQYQGLQTSPTQATLAGTLTITSQSTQGFGGTLAVTETDASGGMRQLSGVVSGCTLTATSVDFDALLLPETVARRHLGTVKGDSITGDWVKSDATGIIASGSFKSARVSGP